MEKIFEIIKDNPIQFGIVNYLAGVLSGHWLAIGRDNRKFYHDTAKNFRYEFVKDISFAINGQWDKVVAEQVIKAVPLQGIAVNEFRMYLGWYKRRGFDLAWNEYKNYVTV